jgi:Skp family chaperone for outer membrane proteins
MRAFTAAVAGTVMGLAGLAGGKALAALQEKPAPPAPAVCTPVAWVSINRVMKEIPRAKKLTDDLTREHEALKKALSDREKELRTKAEELPVRLDPGTPEYDKERRAIEMEISGLKYDDKYGIDAIVRKQVQGMAAIYKEICAAGEVAAKARGYAYVISVETDPITVEAKGQLVSPTDLKLQMAMRTVLWAKPEADITGDVIAALSK